jgi:hypothetical protein
MTRDDIIKLAREAGFEDHSNPELWDCMIAPHNAIARFAALVAAAEREACAEVADAWQNAIHDPRYECDCATAIRARGETK